jgi:hypothetical protein
MDNGLDMDFKFSNWIGYGYLIFNGYPSIENTGSRPADWLPPILARLRSLRAAIRLLHGVGIE